MKIKKRILAVVLAVMMLVPIGVVAAELTGVLSIGKTDTIEIDDLKDYTIVYYNSSYAKKCAERIQTAITSRTGTKLPMVTDATAETDKEILVGKTNRDESKELRATYERPNVCYDIAVDGAKLVVMAEGYKTLDYAAEKMENYLSNNSNISFDGSVYDCDISPALDTLGESMIERAEGTDLRVFHWNMAAPLISNDKQGVYKKVADLYDDKLRAEIIADVILQMQPDIITTNEYYNGHWSGVYEASMKELAEYYDVLASEYETGKPNPESVQVEVSFPSVKYTVNSNILHRKELNLEVIWSGFRYGPQTSKTDYFHGFHSAVFEMKNGQQFLISVGHYDNSESSNTWAVAHNAAVADAKTNSGAASDIPTILTGDMYTGYRNTSANSGYKYWVNQGYSDSQMKAVVNANDPEGCIDNNNRRHGTYHDAGVRQIQRISEDFIWTKNMHNALKFKVLTSMDIDDCSDHYPVMADIKFK